MAGSSSVVKCLYTDGGYCLSVNAFELHSEGNEDLAIQNQSRDHVIHALSSRLAVRCPPLAWGAFTPQDPDTANTSTHRQPQPSIELMGKKRQPQYIHHNKPATTTHPSLSRFTGSSSQPSTSSVSPSTVNERLALLRRTQAAPRDADTPPIIEPSTAPLSKTLMESDPLPITNRLNTTRPPPGPAAPPSWSAAKTSAQIINEDYETLIATYRGAEERLDHLPGIRVTSPGSLLHTSMKSLAKHWDWHTHYDQYHLATLPGNLKSQLLSYISVYGPERGVSIQGLHRLFAAESEAPGATSSEDVTRLDLSYSATRSISLKQLQRYLGGSSPASATSSTQGNNTASAEDDSWEACVDKVPASLSSTPFPYLTHLSLSYPETNATWSELLLLAPHITTITHLSLAGWPVPALTSPFKFPTTHKLQASTPSTQPQSATGLPDYKIRFTETSLSEAATVLRRLSKATYCLKWLDLKDCHDWLRALYRAPLEHGPDWAGAWRGLETIILRQAYSLSALLDHDQRRQIAERLRWALNYEEERLLGSEIDMMRKAIGLPYLRLVYSGDHPFEDPPIPLFGPIE